VIPEGPTKIARVLLINPPQVEGGRFLDGYQGTRPVLPPLGLACIAAYMEQHGYRVDILDGMVESVTPEEVARRTRDYDLAGITSTTFQVLLAYGVLREIRRINPSLPIVIGGAHVSSVPIEPLAMGLADFSVIGEGEEALLQIIRAIENGSDFRAIKGVALRRGDRIESPDGAGMMPDLDALPLPARHLLPMPRYRTSAVRTRRFPAASMMTSRGCPMRCSFCYNNQGYRSRVRLLSAERIVAEMRHLVAQYGIREIHFWDDNFLGSKARIRELCARIAAEGMGVPFDCEATINAFDADLLRRLKQAGLFSVSYGIESGNQRMLDQIHKHTTVARIREVVRETKRIGLDVRGYFMFGFPSETGAEMRETIAFANSLGLTDATFSLLVPLPGTEDYEKVKDAPGFMRDYWLHVILSEISFPKLPLVYCPETVSSEELLRLHRYALRSFYVRPSQLAAKAWRAARSFAILKESLKGLRSLAGG